MAADPHSQLGIFLQSCVDTGWPLALFLGLLAIYLTIRERNHP